MGDGCPLYCGYDSRQWRVDSGGKRQFFRFKNPFLAENFNKKPF